MHEHIEGNCLFCMTNKIYDRIEMLKENNWHLSNRCKALEAEIGLLKTIMNRKEDL